MCGNQKVFIILCSKMPDLGQLWWKCSLSIVITGVIEPQCDSTWSEQKSGTTQRFKYLEISSTTKDVVNIPN